MAFSVAMFIMILVVLVEAIRSWIRLSTLPQDFRTQEEVEAESYAKLAKQAEA